MVSLTIFDSIPWRGKGRGFAAGCIEGLCSLALRGRKSGWLMAAVGCPLPAVGCPLSALRL